jgi:hypothetical protein
MEVVLMGMAFALRSTSSMLEEQRRDIEGTRSPGRRTNRGSPKVFTSVKVVTRCVPQLSSAIERAVSLSDEILLGRP